MWRDLGFFWWELCLGCHTVYLLKLHQNFLWKMSKNNKNKFIKTSFWSTVCHLWVVMFMIDLWTLYSCRILLMIQNTLSTLNKLSCLPWSSAVSLAQFILGAVNIQVCLFRIISCHGSDRGRCFLLYMFVKNAQPLKILVSLLPGHARCQISLCYTVNRLGKHSIVSFHENWWKACFQDKCLKTFQFSKLLVKVLF